MRAKGGGVSQRHTITSHISWAGHLVCRPACSTSRLWLSNLTSPAGEPLSAPAQSLLYFTGHSSLLPSSHMHVWQRHSKGLYMPALTHHPAPKCLLFGMVTALGFLLQPHQGGAQLLPVGWSGHRGALHLLPLLLGHCLLWTRWVEGAGWGLVKNMTWYPRAVLQ
jgi:hypothetical protein